MEAKRQVREEKIWSLLKGRRRFSEDRTAKEQVRIVLLWSSRMGSFTSAPKILNEDTQDGDVDLPPRMSRDELMQHCHQQLGNLPPLVKRSFRRLQGQSGDTPDGVRVLQWNVLSRGTLLAILYNIRLIQKAFTRTCSLYRVIQGTFAFA